MPSSFHDIEERARERAIVVANLEQGRDPDEQLHEIRELLQTAGVETIGTVVQSRPMPHPRTFIGSGKLEELERLVQHLDPDIVVVDDELTPNQNRNIENAVQRRVIDRTAVILDIFALHAHTAQGKLQVELAQLQYYLTRARGMWTHLDSVGGGAAGGGVGTRGPGESQLETDRRIARGRINQLRRRLKDQSTQRETRRQSRQQSVVPKVALAGYTNAGKSTLLNALTGSSVSSKDQLFETLDATTRRFEREGRTYLMTDTVGFIERLPHQLVDAFASTLEETLLADLIVLVADGSLPRQQLSAQIGAVRDVLESIGAGQITTLLALNKADRLSEADREAVVREHRGAVTISARTGEGLEALMDTIGQQFAERFQRVELLVPYAQAGLLHDLYTAGAPVERTDTEDGIHAVAHVPVALLGRLDEYRIAEAAIGDGAHD